MEAEGPGSSFGTSQAQRLPRALAPGSAQLDARDQAELLAMGARFGSLFAFYEHGGARNGTFERFFTVDGQVSAALVATFPLQSFRRRLANTLAATPETPLPYGLDTLMRLWEFVGLWSSSLPHEGPFAPLRARVFHEGQSKVVPAIIDVLDLLDRSQGEFDPSYTDRVLAVLNGHNPDLFGQASVRTAQRVSATGSSPPTQGPQELLARSATLTVEALASTIQTARALLDTVAPLHGRTPQMALFIAFLRQFELFRQRLNALPQRHLDFYYEKVLGQSPKAGSGEYTWVALSLKPHAPLAVLPAGLVVGAKDSAALEFHTMTAVPLSHARLTSGMTAHVALGKRGERGLRTQDVVIAPQGASPMNTAGWPTFGSPEKPPTSENPNTDSTTPVPQLGIAVAALALLGVTGKRTLTLTLDAPKASQALDWSSLLQVQVSAGKTWLTAVPAPVSGGKPSASVVSPPSSATVTSGTTAGSAAPTASEAEGTITLQVTLAAETAAAAPPSSEQCDPGWPKGVPILKLLADPKLGHSIPLELANLQIRAIELQLHVVGATAGQLKSSSGPLPAHGACAPLGTTPEVASFLELDGLPTSVGKLRSLTLNLQWKGLPTPDSGFPEEFASYYKGYVTGPEVSFPEVAAPSPAQGSSGSPAKGTTPSTTPTGSTPASGTGPEPGSTGAGTYVEGTDVSDNQGSIDWASVAGAGLGFAFIKASEGNLEHYTWFAPNWEASQKTSLLRGATHYFYANADGKEQARIFLSRFPSGYDGQLPPALDLDYKGLIKGDGGPKAAIQTALAWLRTVEQATRRKPVIYAGGQSLSYLQYPNELADYPHWIANSHEPRLPSSWGPWTFWQYGQRQVAGIGGHVDVDRFHGNLAELNAFARGGALKEAVAVPLSHSSESTSTLGSLREQTEDALVTAAEGIEKNAGHEGLLSAAENEAKKLEKSLRGPALEVAENLANEEFSDAVGDIKSGIENALHGTRKPTSAHPSGTSPKVATPVPFASSVFVVGAAMRAEEQWQPVLFDDGQPLAGLFVDAGDTMKSLRRFRFKVADGPPPPPGARTSAAAPARSLTNLPSGLRLELAGPNYGFGKHLFATSVNVATLANAAQLLSETVAAQAPASSAADDDGKSNSGANSKGAQTKKKGAAGTAPAGAPKNELSEIDDDLQTAAKVVGKGAFALTIRRWFWPVVFAGTALAGLFKLLKRLFKRKPPAPPKPDPAPTPDPSPPTGPVVQPIPNPPFTPMTTSITLDFIGAKQTLYRHAEGSHQGYGEIWHIAPVERTAAGGRELPTAAAPFVPSLQSGNTLILDLDDATPGQTLSLLWVATAAPGAADVDGSSLRWSVSNNQGGWTSVEPTLVLGGWNTAATNTRPCLPTLSRPELIHLPIPADAAPSSGGTQAPALRLRISDSSGRHNSTTFGIFMNAALAQRSAPIQPGATVIAARTLTMLKPALGTVAQVVQPLPGFGGRPSESPSDMTARVSERLRHKGRGLTSWDYERLALESSPALFAAKCIPGTERASDGKMRSKAGSVSLVVVPRNAPGGEISGAEPQLQPGELERVQAALMQVMPGNAQLHVYPASYRMFSVRCSVSAAPGIASTAAQGKLERDLRAHFSAWYYQPSKATRILANVPSPLEVTRFINSRDYIRNVVGACTVEISPDSPDTPYTVPLSSEHHEITVL